MRSNPSNHSDGVGIGEVGAIEDKAGIKYKTSFQKNVDSVWNIY